MANSQLFQSIKGRFLPNANTNNFAGAPAYALSKQQQLAQYAATGCLNATFYASAEAQLETVMQLCSELDAQFIAQTAVYCRERGYMKDMPALLVAALAVKTAPELPRTFKRVINNGKMLRNFVQIIRSGATGRKSMGSRPKKLVQAWLNSATEKELLAAAVGNNPSLADVVKMVHPKPVEAWREAFFAWLIGKPCNVAALPPLVTAFEAYKQDRTQAIPEVPFQMLTAMELNDAAWAKIALQGGWQMVRMNLNTFARQGVFALPGMTEAIAAKLKDADAIAKSKVFPYQLMAAYLACSNEVPIEIREALEDALEIALVNIPEIAGKVVVCPDVSGSMQSAVTGNRGSASSKIRCIDVAALIAAAVLRKNRDAMLIPFEVDVVDCRINPRDTVMTNAQKLASIGGGGTNCSAPLAQMNKAKTNADLVIYVSDNESWIDATSRGATATLREWEIFKQRNPTAKLVCINVTPSKTSQVVEREDILNIGGFSDDVFKIIAAFAADQLNAMFWVNEIKSINI
ncbi:RNA-binding protein [Undibacterium seohonense]|uniref:RNA-binding protein n=1 Tax=Undibacterium seohonense TaxID=1344950 RepID=A0ABR6X8G3_9BURK|nr:RNA-binding protein [Undibacterium seohonense]MBC3809227.1 RNA-binding protein [Undibacterium seohonense]